MNIEESIGELKGYLTWLEANRFSKLVKDSAIETLLTAYEKEKEKNKKINEYVRQCDWHDNDVYIGEDILDILEEE